MAIFWLVPSMAGTQIFLIFGIDRHVAVDSHPVVDVVEHPVESLGIYLELLDMLYQKQITTISNIPPPCRLNFSRALKTALDKILAKPTDLSAWIQLLLLPICTLSLYIPKNTSEERSGTRKKL